MNTFDIQYIFIGNLICPVLFIYERGWPPLASWATETDFMYAHTHTL